MNALEAREVLAAQLAIWRQQSYAALSIQIGVCSHAEIRGSSGTMYQIEITPEWDDQPKGVIRVLGCVDDGGMRAFVPLTDDFLIGPDGQFVDEQAV